MMKSVSFGGLRRTVAFVVGASVLLSACSPSDDVVLGKLFSTKAIETDVNLGHWDNHDRYLPVCPGTAKTEVEEKAGQTINDYPTEGFPEKSAIILLGNDGTSDVHTYSVKKLDLCRKVPGFEARSIDTPLHVKKIDDVWVPEFTSAEASTLSSEQPSTGDNADQAVQNEQPAQPEQGQQPAQPAPPAPPAQ